MRRPFPLALALLVVATPASGQANERDTVPTALVGRWEGKAALDSGSIDAGAPVSIRIARDGSVTGTIGDATLRNARLVRNPSLFARLFRLGTPWMLEATLEGALIEAKSLTRQRARLPLELTGDILAGDLNASGGGPLLSVRVRLLKVD